MLQSRDQTRPRSLEGCGEESVPCSSLSFWGHWDSWALLGSWLHSSNLSPLSYGILPGGLILTWLSLLYLVPSSIRTEVILD